MSALLTPATFVPPAVAPESVEFRRPTRQEMRAMGKTEARELSDALFERLAGLERGSAAYSYVRGTVIELNMPLVRFVAAGFRHRAAEPDDILQVGTVGLIKAVDGYDHRRGVEFLTYAIPTIAGEIKRFFRDTSWPVRVPRGLQELYLRVIRCSDRLEQRLGRSPEPEELAADLGLDVADVDAALRVGRAYRAGSLDALHDDHDDETGSTLLDRLGDEDGNLTLVDFRESVRPLLADLTPRERTVLMLRFWGGCTQSEIAERIDCSQMQVSRLLAATLGSLRARLEEPAADTP
ncbi:RNA polymerase sigma-B factor [Kitasatospora herbaricolor]|uniref:SigB/SigF/SigG family RNA polymerase sigma factor n=1 Tax=Kitasatospora herbaricolor TaxID=68217 RepID=UPI0027940A81|nr:SigB/SigF/SigG family RNA polymerase sigma factor [Kitasatospora herbaricolor]MDQ0306133.1 RNA polymerase sigma-B factor [Kitasatospora herbaricolor]